MSGERRRGMVGRKTVGVESVGWAEWAKDRMRGQSVLETGWGRTGLVSTVECTVVETEYRPKDCGWVRKYILNRKKDMG
jgi:hypothetical protein